MAETDAPSILSITTTVPEREQGLALARAALTARLAACVQVDAQPITSVYRWQGRVCEEAEWRVTFKTAPGCEPALHEMVAAQHPYALPQWLLSPLQASRAYADWVRAETVG
ncbi:divalent cation tolerance protein CutA [Ramlibacter sp. 2FC]|uniref:divalent-cation tolerance protein CutA n=1 Tax=Ramlibacter sp. 2FC TaxID=2502188 RepID=UPI0010F4E036|nr:divalent cation tolerance protein CutA [Ramlibacter sp. 2FC]